MLPSSRSIAIAAGLILGLLVAVSAWEIYGDHQVNRSWKDATVLHDTALADAGRGAAYDQQADAQRSTIEAHQAEIERLRKVIAGLGPRRPAPTAAPIPPADPERPDPLPADRPVAMDVAKDQLIAAQDRLIVDQATQIHTLTLARDSWRRAAQESAAEAVQLRSALAARQGLERAARWQGRIEGFVVGAATGWAGGKI